MVGYGHNLRSNGVNDKELVRNIQFMKTSLSKDEMDLVECLFNESLMGN